MVDDMTRCKSEEEASIDGADRPLSVSICIPSKNRPLDISRCLQSIQKQTVLPLETIIVDQSSQPYDLPSFAGLIHIWDRTISGSAAARNIAWAKARGDIVLFLDDDTELHPDCTGELLRGFERFPDAIALQFDVGDLEQPLSFNRLHNLIFQRGFFNSSPIRRGAAFELRRLAGCATAFRHNLLKTERFDEALIGYSYGEDWEFSQRARHYGRLLLIPGNFVVHHAVGLNRYKMEQMQIDRWVNFLYFYDKLNAKRHWANRFWRLWWMLGESIRWLRYGLGFPILGIWSRRAPKRSLSLSPDVQSRTSGSI